MDRSELMKTVEALLHPKGKGSERARGKTEPKMMQQLVTDINLKTSRFPHRILFFELMSSCLDPNPEQRPSFNILLEKLMTIQKALSPDGMLNVVKSFTFTSQNAHEVSDTIQCMTYIPPDQDKQGGMVWVGCGDGSIWIFDSDKRELSYSKNAHAKRVICLIYLPSQGVIWTASMDQTIKIWKPKSGNMVKILGGIDDTISCMILVQGNVWCGSLNGKLYVWDATSLQCKMVEAVKGAVWSMVFHEGIVWASSGKDIVRWNPTTFNKVDVLTSHEKTITSLISVGSEVWSGSQDCTIRVWKGNSCIKILKKHTRKVYTLMTYNSECVWSGSWDKSIIVWNASTKEPLQVLKGKHNDCISSMITVPSETGCQSVWSGSWDKSICFWH